MLKLHSTGHSIPIVCPTISTFRPATKINVRVQLITSATVVLILQCFSNFHHTLEVVHHIQVVVNVQPLPQCGIARSPHDVVLAIHLATLIT